MKRIWSFENEDKLKGFYPHTSNRELAKIFNVSYLQIKNKAKALKLKKSPEHILAMNKASIGKHFSPQTQFKKGHKPVNTKHNGCITTRIYKGRPYKFIRLGENKWVRLHRFRYEMMYGFIPNDKVIIFSDGNSMNLNIENLIPVTRQELMIRNSIHRPKDNLELYLYLTNALNFRDKLKEQRLIRRIENEQQRRIRIAELKEQRLIRRTENEQQRRIRIAELKEQRLIRSAENEQQRRIRIAELKEQRLIRSAENKKRKNFEIRKRRLNRNKFGRSSRIATDFIKSNYSHNDLMEMGKLHLGFAVKFMRDMDNAKDAIMNVLCYFIEGNIKATNEEFIKRLTYECKLLMKDSYKKISFQDIEYKLNNLEEVYEY